MEQQSNGLVVNSANKFAHNGRVLLSVVPTLLVLCLYGGRDFIPILLVGIILGLVLDMTDHELLVVLCIWLTCGVSAFRLLILSFSMIWDDFVSLFLVHAMVLFFFVLGLWATLQSKSLRTSHPDFAILFEQLIFGILPVSSSVILTWFSGFLFEFDVVPIACCSIWLTQYYIFQTPAKSSFLSLERMPVGRIPNSLLVNEGLVTLVHSIFTWIVPCYVAYFYRQNYPISSYLCMVSIFPVATRVFKIFKPHLWDWVDGLEIGPIDSFGSSAFINRCNDISSTICLPIIVGVVKYMWLDESQLAVHLPSFAYHVFCWVAIVAALIPISLKMMNYNKLASNVVLVISCFGISMFSVAYMLFPKYIILWTFLYILTLGLAVMLRKSDLKLTLIRFGTFAGAFFLFMVTSSLEEKTPFYMFNDYILVLLLVSLGVIALFNPDWSGASQSAAFKHVCMAILAFVAVGIVTDLHTLSTAVKDNGTAMTVVIAASMIFLWTIGHKLGLILSPGVISLAWLLAMTRGVGYFGTSALQSPFFIILLLLLDLMFCFFAIPVDLQGSESQRRMDDLSWMMIKVLSMVFVTFFVVLISFLIPELSDHCWLSGAACLVISMVICYVGAHFEDTKMRLMRLIPLVLAIVIFAPRIDVITDDLDIVIEHTFNGSPSFHFEHPDMFSWIGLFCVGIFVIPMGESLTALLLQIGFVSTAVVCWLYPEAMPQPIQLFSLGSILCSLFTFLCLLACAFRAKFIQKLSKIAIISAFVASVFCIIQILMPHNEDLFPADLYHYGISSMIIILVLVLFASHIILVGLYQLFSDVNTMTVVQSGNFPSVGFRNASSEQTTASTVDATPPKVFLHLALGICTLAVVENAPLSSFMALVLIVMGCGGLVKSPPRRNTSGSFDVDFPLSQVISICLSIILLVTVSFNESVDMISVFGMAVSIIVLLILVADHTGVTFEESSGLGGQGEAPESAIRMQEIGVIFAVIIALIIDFTSNYDADGHRCSLFAALLFVCMHIVHRVIKTESSPYQRVGSGTSPSSL